MSHGGAPYTDIQAGINSPLRGEQDKSYMFLDEPLGNEGSLGQALLSDVEDPTADTLSQQSLGAHGNYHDRRWAYAFKVNVIMTIVGAIFFGSQAFEAISSDQKLGGLGERRLSGESDTYTWVPVFFGGLGLVALGSGIALGILHSLINCGKHIMWTLMGLITLSWLSLIVKLGVSGSIFGAALAGLFFYLLVRFFHRRRARFDFGAANLKVAAMAIKSMPGTILTSLLMSGVQLLWVLVSLVAALGSYASLETVAGSDGSTHRAIYCKSRDNLSNQGCFCENELVSPGTCEYRGLGVPLMVFWLVTMAWGSLVIQNVVTSTVSGSVAAWWFSRNDTKPVKGALYRALHYSFGTLCKAAAIVTMVRLFFSVLRRALRRVPAPLRVFLSCIFNLVEDAFAYFMSYAVTFVGIYGLDFDSAVRRVREVFTSKGLTTLRNDIIVDLAIGFVAFSASLVFVVISWFVLIELYAVNKAWSFQLVALFVFGYMAFLVMVATVLEVVRSAVKAVFVCFVQDPGALRVTHGADLYNELNAAWVQIRPGGFRS